MEARQDRTEQKISVTREELMASKHGKQTAWKSVFITRSQQSSHRVTSSEVRWVMFRS
jgi:hypothetical protein